jgi:PAS domain S-box-containing protein
VTQSCCNSTSSDPQQLLVCHSLQGLCPLFENIGASLAILSLDGMWLDVNKSLCDLMCYSRSELLAVRYEDYFHAVDPESMRESRRNLLAGKLSSYSTVRTAVSRSGRALRFRCIVSLVRDEATGEPLYLVQVMDEISDQVATEEALRAAQNVRDELGRLMTNAQDHQRSQIARELHDDIGQSLAVLKAQLAREGFFPPDAHRDARASFAQFACKVQLVADKVRLLSHQLHSPELEYLGLVVAIKGHCIECAHEFQVPIDCACDEIRLPIDGSVSLALFRVLQEALHNVVKHSNCTHIAVNLTSAGQNLLLTIQDNGKGFDIEDMQRLGGVGLISMRERMHLAGGSLEILSAPGDGTTLHATASIRGKQPFAGSYIAPEATTNGRQLAK